MRLLRLLARLRGRRNREGQLNKLVAGCSKCFFPSFKLHSRKRQNPSWVAAIIPRSPKLDCSKPPSFVSCCHRALLPSFSCCHFHFVHPFPPFLSFLPPWLWHLSSTGPDSCHRASSGP